MSVIQIHRVHNQGLAQARRAAQAWMGHVQKKYAMQCHYEQGHVQDMITFSRPQVDGNLRITATHFFLYIRLGFLLSPFRVSIEQAINRNMDALLRPKGVPKPQKPAV